MENAARIIDRLTRTYRKHGLVLALGAGVSKGAGLPDWRELLQRIGEKRFGGDARQILKELIDNGFSYPSIAGMLRAHYADAEAFADVVREELYSGFPFFPGGVTQHTAQSLIDRIEANPKAQTFRSVAAFCAAKDAKHPGWFVRNPKVHAIVNFNIDTVLREYIEARYPRFVDPKSQPRRKGQKLIVRTVERASKSSDVNKISVYHVHGNLRFDLKAHRRSKESADKLVLAEQEYFDFFNSPTSLFNYTFLYFLREYSVLFIGLSMKDDNLRRLLHYSRKERFEAFIDEDKQGNKQRSSEELERDARRHFVILEEPESATRRDLIAGALSYLGAAPIWIKGFKEVPEVLGSVYAANQNAWNSVY